MKYIKLWLNVKIEMYQDVCENVEEMILEHNKKFKENKINKFRIYYYEFNTQCKASNKASRWILIEIKNNKNFLRSINFLMNKYINIFYYLITNDEFLKLNLNFKNCKYSEMEQIIV